jgi:hypothetical protein
LRFLGTSASHDLHQLTHPLNVTWHLDLLLLGRCDCGGRLL